MIEQRILAGLLDDSTEFFSESVDHIPQFVKSGKITSCEQMDEALYQTMLEDAKSNAKWWAILEDWHPGNERRKVYQHIACRYGAPNSTPDIDKEGRLNVEVRVCNRCTTCPGFGEGCARIEGLTRREMLSVLLLAQGLADKQVADRMGISFFTLNEFKRRISVKLNAHSKIDIINKFYNAIM